MSLRKKVYLYDSLPGFSAKYVFPLNNRKPPPLAKPLEEGSYSLYFPDAKKLSTSQNLPRFKEKKEGIILSENKVEEKWLSSGYSWTKNFDSSSEMWLFILECLYQQLNHHLRDVISRYRYEIIDFPNLFLSGGKIGYSEECILYLLKKLNSKKETIRLRPYMIFTTKFQSFYSEKDIKKNLEYRSNLKETEVFQDHPLEMPLVIEPLDKKDFKNEFRKQKKKLDDMKDSREKKQLSSLYHDEAQYLADLVNMAEIEKLRKEIYEDDLIQFY